MNNNPLATRPQIRPDSAPALKPQAHAPTVAHETEGLHRMLSEYVQVRAHGSSKAKHALAAQIGMRMTNLAKTLMMTNDPAIRAKGWNALHELHNAAEGHGKNLKLSMAPMRALLEEHDVNTISSMRQEIDNGADANRHAELRTVAQNIALTSPSGAARRLAENFLQVQSSVPQRAPQAKVNQPQMAAFIDPQPRQGAGLRPHASVPAQRREQPARPQPQADPSMQQHEQDHLMAGAGLPPMNIQPRVQVPPSPPQSMPHAQMPDPQQFGGREFHNDAPRNTPMQRHMGVQPQSFAQMPSPPITPPPAKHQRLNAGGVNMRQQHGGVQGNAIHQRSDVPQVLRPGFVAPAQAAQQQRPAAPVQRANGPRSLPKMMPATKRKAEEIFSPEQLRAMGLPRKMKVRELTAADGRRYYMTETRRQGGFGKVRYAIDDQGNKWALKEFRTEKSPWKHNAKTRITNEADVMKEIQRLAEASPSVQVGHIMNVNGKVYVSMTSMHDEVAAINNHGVKVTNRKAVARDVTRQMARDLAHTNAMGYVHRDVKLENALYDADGRVMISDFGLAYNREKDGPANVAGTPIYMAPEQFTGRYDAKVDTWSLGRAFMDAHIGRTDPFAWAGMDKAGEAHNSFREWRRELIAKDGTGRIDLSQIKGAQVGRRDKTGWDESFNRIAIADPEACQYLLEHMLNPDPMSRHTTAQVHEFFEKRRPEENSLEHQAVKQHWGQEMIKDTTTDELVGGLRSYVQTKRQLGIG